MDGVVCFYLDKKRTQDWNFRCENTRILSLYNERDQIYTYTLIATNEAIQFENR